MARYAGARCRLCRREGMKLFLKGPKCSTEKCPFAKRPTPPGMHTHGSSKPSYYALQLREKQKAKRMYGMLERQFKRFFQLATKTKGVTGRKLIELLERRLDNVVFRSLFAFSRQQARQMVLHGLIYVNGRRVNIPSFLVREADKIEISAKEELKKLIKETIEINEKDRSVPGWLKADKQSFTIVVERSPQKEDLVIPIKEQYIVELYSK